MNVYAQELADVLEAERMRDRRRKVRPRRRSRKPSRLQVELLHEDFRMIRGVPPRLRQAIAAATCSYCGAVTATGPTCHAHSDLPDLDPHYAMEQTRPLQLAS